MISRVDRDVHFAVRAARTSRRGLVNAHLKGSASTCDVQRDLWPLVAHRKRHVRSAGEPAFESGKLQRGAELTHQSDVHRARGVSCQDVLTWPRWVGRYLEFSLDAVKLQRREFTADEAGQQTLLAAVERGVRGRVPGGQQVAAI